MEKEKEISKEDGYTIAFLGYCLVELRNLAEQLVERENLLTFKGAISPKEAAFYLGKTSEERVLAMCKANKFRCIKKGSSNQWLIDFESLVEYKKKIFSPDFMLDEFFINQHKIEEKARAVSENEAKRMGVKQWIK